MGRSSYDQSNERPISVRRFVFDGLGEPLAVQMVGLQERQVPTDGGDEGERDGRGRDVGCASRSSEGSHQLEQREHPNPDRRRDIEVEERPAVPRMPKPEAPKLPEPKQPGRHDLEQLELH